MVIAPKLIVNCFVESAELANLHEPSKSVLFVPVSVEVLVRTLSVKSGNVSTRLAVCAKVSVVDVPVVAPDDENFVCFVLSPLSTN